MASMNIIMFNKNFADDDSLTLTQNGKRLFLTKKIKRKKLFFIHSQVRSLLLIFSLFRFLYRIFQHQVEIIDFVIIFFYFLQIFRKTQSRESA
jgi:hypothetical protein